MSFLERLLGRQPESGNGSSYPNARRSSAFAGGTRAFEPLTDEQAVERYRYLLRTAPPDAIEQAHAEAFAQLTPEQRRSVLDGISSDLTPDERAAGDDPQALARLATRAELRRPGTLERAFGSKSVGGGIGAGAFATGNLLNTIAAVVIGSAIADAIFSDGGYDQGYEDGSEAAESNQDFDAADAGSDSGDAGFDTGADFGGGDFGGNF